MFWNSFRVKGTDINWTFYLSQGFLKTVKKHKIIWHGFHLELVLESASE